MPEMRKQCPAGLALLQELWNETVKLKSITKWEYSTLRKS